MDKKILQNYFYNILYQLLVVLAPMITVPYVTRTLGATMLGISDWTGSNVQWFVLFGIMGVSIYGNREIARVRDDQTKMSKTFFEIFTMQFLSMCASTLVYFLYLFTVQDSVRLYATIQTISLLSVALDITWFFYGVEDFKTASIRNMIIKILGIILIFAFVKKPSDLALFIVINAGSGVLGQLIMWTQLKQYVKWTPIHFKDVLKHFKPNLMLFIPQIATSVYTMLDVSMLGYLYADVSHVSFYNQAQRFIKMFLFFITSIGSVMLPRIANIHAKGQDEEVLRFLRTTLRLALYLAIPMIAGIISLIPYFIGWFLDDTYQIVTPLIIFTTPIILFISLSNVFGTQYLLPIGRTKEYTRSVILGALTNFCLNALLMPKFGAFGAITGSVIAELMVTLTQWLSIRGQLDLGFRVREVTKYVIASLVMMLPVHFIGEAMGPRFTTNLIQIAAGVIVYFGLLTLMKDDFHMNLIRKVLNHRKGEAAHE
jgi:O-antigen/teichoic acid export membrane protein